MNTKLIAVIIGILILLAGVGGFFFLNNSSQKQTSEVSTGAKTGSDVNSAVETLKGLISSGKSQQCTYTVNVSGTQLKGMVYASGGRVRTDVETTIASRAITAHMVTDADYMYSWTDASNQGYKFSIADAEKSAGAVSKEKTQAPDFNQKYNFDCKSWSGDASLFTLPANITFTTFAMPNTSPAAVGEQGSPSSCTVCAGIPEGQGKTECLNLYHCQ